MKRLPSVLRPRHGWLSDLLFLLLFLVWLWLLWTH